MEFLYLQCLLLILSLHAPLILHCKAARDTLKYHQTLFDGQTLVSPNKRFEMGFFNPWKTNQRYIGIWYKEIRPLTAVWVGNRNNPLADFSGHLKLAHNGIMLYNKNANATTTLVWSFPISLSVKNPTLQLLDSGNLVLRLDHDPNPNGFIWESFDHPLDTWLPGMKLGWNVTEHSNKYLTSWRTHMDPGTGEFRISIDPPEAPQLVIYRRNLLKYRWGPWNGDRFSGCNDLTNNSLFNLVYESNDEEVYYLLEVGDNSTISRFWATPWGSMAYQTWKNDKGWSTEVKIQGDFCDLYGICGPYAKCNHVDDVPKCQCLEGFVPRSPVNWSKFEWSEGCERRWELSYGNGDGFVRYKGLKLPDYSRVSKKVLSMEGCRNECLRDSACIAYTHVNVHGNGDECLVWFDSLIDIRDSSNHGNEIYIRMARDELEVIAREEDREHKKVAFFVVVAVAALLLAFGMIAWYGPSRSSENSRASLRVSSLFQGSIEENGQEDVELPLLDFKTIFDATNNFSSDNIIGKGGFGPVYKGVLANGEEIAVKRLSENSSQGLQEFINEVNLISKLQHRNLVRLLGCCVHKKERMLVYEYMPNTSLDQFIFDEQRRSELPWNKCFSIILGVARGLVYLHEDSRLRIIHRDLKASNILLDSEMNPKISDFGIAKIFGEDEAQNTTGRVYGTRGYMSPEYAFSGCFSAKSDAFSFGVLMIEIISGKKNWRYQHPEHDTNLVGHAWELWHKGDALGLMDESLKDSFIEDEVNRCIHVGLLCVQPRPEDRPTMSNVLLMLQGSSNIVLPVPKEPGFCGSSSGAVSSSMAHCSISLNLIDLTTLVS